MEPHPPEAPLAVAPDSEQDHEPAKIEPVGSVACTFNAHRAVAGMNIDIRVRKAAVSNAGDAAVVRVHEASATVGFPIGKEGYVAVSAETKDTRIDGFAARHDVPLFVRPSHSLLGGVLVPGPELPLEVMAAEPGLLRVHFAGSALLDVPEALADDSIPCADIDTIAFPLPPAQSGKAVSLDAKNGLEIRATPDSTVFVTLHVPEATVDLPIEATKLEAQSNLVRVEIPTGRGFLRGWVPASLVHPRARSTHALARRDDAAPGDKPEPKAKSEGVECRVAVPFAVPETTAKDAKLVWIGSTRPETTLVPSNEPQTFDDAFRAVVIRDVSANVPILVRAEALAACMKKL